MKGKRFTRGLAIIAVAATLAPTAMPSTAARVPSVVAGMAELADGSWISIVAQSSAVRPTLGSVMLVTSMPTRPAVIGIELDCLDVSLEVPIYPIPPYLPYHLVQASGRDAGGTRYFITGYDLVAAPVGFGDRMAVALERGEGSCGARAELAEPIRSGDLLVGP